MTNKEFKQIGSMLSAHPTKSLAQQIEEELEKPDPSKEAWEKMLAKEAELKEQDKKSIAERDKKAADKIQELSERISRL